MKRAFTLAEVTLVLALLLLIYGMLLFVVSQVGMVSRRTTVAAAREHDIVKACEQIRWQLRCLFSQTDPQPATNTTAAANVTAANAPLPSQTAGMVGQAGSGLYGQHSGEGRDVLLFVTTRPKGRAGVVEVGYKLADNKSTVSDLLVRQFPTRSVGGFHSPVDQADGPWKSLLTNVRQFAVDYSKDSYVWQREWDETDAPRRVRIHLETSSGEVVDFQISPGIAAGRW